MWCKLPKCDTTSNGAGRRPARWNPPLEWSALWRLTLIAGAALAATFISPDPIDRLFYPFSSDLRHPIFRIFVEMRPLHHFLLAPPYVAGVVYIVAALVLVSVVKRFGEYRLWELALLGGVALLGSVAVRSLMDWYVIMLAVGLPHVVGMYVASAKKRPLTRRLRNVLRLDNGLKRLFKTRSLRWQPAWPLAAAGALAAATIFAAWRDLPHTDSPAWPVAAVDHIESVGLHGNFFAPPDFGAYLGWRLKDQAKIYTDTRGFFFPPALIEDSHYVPALGPAWRQRLDRVLNDYPTDYFLLETWGIRGALWKTLAPHVPDPLFLDDKTVLLSADQVRRGLARLDAESDF